MELLQIAALVLLIYFAVIILISAVRALLALGKGKGQVKGIFRETFRETFWDFFLELINPFNWI